MAGTLFFGSPLRVAYMSCMVLYMSKAEYLEMAVKAGLVVEAQRRAGQDTDRTMAAVRRFKRLASKAV